MKNIFISLFLLIIVFNNNYAQPIITSDWFYTNGDIVLTAVYYPSNSMPLDEGIGIIWDFSYATPPNEEREIIYVAPSELTNYNEFPDATLAYYLNGYITEYYLKMDGDELQLLGTVFNNYKRVYQDGNPIIGYDNFGFQDVKTKTYSELLINLQTNDTSMTIIDDELTYAGFGDVITPLGTFEDCVMTKLIKSKSNSEYIEYRFYKDKLTNLIASYRFYTTNNTEPSKIIQYRINPIITTVNEIDKINLKISGPIENSIFIYSSIEKNVKLQVLNMSGQLIFTQRRILKNGNNELRIDHLVPNNIYVLLITDVDSGSFISYQYYK